MAADQRVTSGGPICHVKKIHRIGKNLYGMAGDVSISLIVMRWLETKQSATQLYKLVPEAYRNDIDLVELSPAGLALWNGWGVRMALLDDSYAVGSGSMAALPMLRSGKSPEDAIGCAIPIDEASGILGTVQVEYLLPPEFARKRRG